MKVHPTSLIYLCLRFIGSAEASLGSGIFETVRNLIDPPPVQYGPQQGYGVYSTNHPASSYVGGHSSGFNQGGGPVQQTKPWGAPYQSQPQSFAATGSNSLLADNMNDWIRRREDDLSEYRDDSAVFLLEYQILFPKNHPTNTKILDDSKIRHNGYVQWNSKLDELFPVARRDETSIMKMSVENNIPDLLYERMGDRAQHKPGSKSPQAPWAPYYMSDQYPTGRLSTKARVLKDYTEFYLEGADKIFNAYIVFDRGAKIIWTNNPPPNSFRLLITADVLNDNHKYCIAAQLDESLQYLYVDDSYHAFNKKHSDCTEITYNVWNRKLELWHDKLGRRLNFVDTHHNILEPRATYPVDDVRNGRPNRPDDRSSQWWIERIWPDSVDQNVPNDKHILAIKRWGQTFLPAQDKSGIAWYVTDQVINHEWQTLPLPQYSKPIDVFMVRMDKPRSRSLVPNLQNRDGWMVDDGAQVPYQNPEQMYGQPGAGRGHDRAGRLNTDQAAGLQEPRVKTVRWADDVKSYPQARDGMSEYSRPSDRSSGQGRMSSDRNDDRQPAYDQNPSGRGPPGDNRSYQPSGPPTKPSYNANEYIDARPAYDRYPSGRGPRGDDRSYQQSGPTTKPSYDAHDQAYKYNDRTDGRSVSPSQRQGHTQDYPIGPPSRDDLYSREGSQYGQANSVRSTQLGRDKGDYREDFGTGNGYGSPLTNTATGGYGDNLRTSTQYGPPPTSYRGNEQMQGRGNSHYRK